MKKAFISIVLTLFLISFAIASLNVNLQTTVDSANSEEKVCCKIYGLGVMMKQVNIHYRLVEKSECEIPEGFVGGGREIVDDEYCEISEECKPVCRAIGSRSEGWYDSCTNKLIEYANCGREFCGRSTKGYCESDGDCMEGGCSGQVCQSKDEEEMITTCEWRDCYDAEEYGFNCTCVDNKCQWHIRRRVRALTTGQVQEVIKIKNKLRINQTGNVIVQIKKINMTTNVTLYHHSGQVYGIFKNNETKPINFLPDQVQEKIRERIRARLENQTIELDEDGIYRIQGKKKARLFFLFPVREKMRMQIDSETGEVIKIRNPWWGFLARDTEEEAEDEEEQEED